MKNRFLLLLVVSTFLVGCQSLSKLTQFDMPYSTSVTIPASTPLNLPFNFSTPLVETNSTQFFTSNGINKDLIDKIVLKKLEMTVSSPTNGNFNFLKSIEIYITADNLPDTKIAWLDNIPDNAPMPLELTVSQDNLQQFIEKDKFGLKIKAMTDEIITTDYKIDVKTIFMIDVKVLGL